MGARDGSPGELACRGGKGPGGLRAPCKLEFRLDGMKLGSRPVVEVGARGTGQRPGVGSGEEEQ